MAIVPKQPPTDRMIVTTYYVDKRKLSCTKVIRSKYPRLAAMRAFDNMSMDFYDAELCIVHDENYGQDHAIFVRHRDGRIETMYKRDQKDPTLMASGSFKLKESKTAKARKLRKAKKEK